MPKLYGKYISIQTEAERGRGVAEHHTKVRVKKIRLARGRPMMNSTIRKQRFTPSPKLMGYPTLFIRMKNLTSSVLLSV